MKILGVWLPRWNALKTLLPIMETARRRGIHVSVVCPRPPLTGEGKPELLAADRIGDLSARWPWAEWSIGGEFQGTDAVIAQGCHGHDAGLIRRSGVPWVAVDHLGENTWARLCWGLKTWEPWSRVCISAPFDGDPAKAVLTGYTAFDGEWPTLEEIRARYGLPERYILLGTAFVPDSVSSWLRLAYLGGIAQPIGRLVSGYTGPSYTDIVSYVKMVAEANGLALVAKSRGKHLEHRANVLADQHLGDEPTDPHRALHLARASLFYAGLASGLALEAAVAGVPSVNWMVYPQESVDHPDFHDFRRFYWTERYGVWNSPGASYDFHLFEPREAAWMQPFIRHLAANTPGVRTRDQQYALRAAGPWRGSSLRVLEAAGVL